MHLHRFLLFVVLAWVGLKAAPQEAAVRPMAAGQALLQKQDWRHAAEQFELALRADPQDADAHFGLALALRGGGQATQALAQANRALALRPDFEEARLALGLMLQQQGDVAGAIAQYRTALKFNPRSAEAHNWLGVAYMQKNQLADAAGAFRSAIRLKPEFVRAYNNLGSTLAQAGDLAEGISAFREGLRYAPQDPQLHLNLGTALRTSGDADGAIREFQMVLKSDPENPEIHHQLGLALREKGELDASAAELELSLRLNPESREGYYALGQVLQRMAAARRRPGPAAPPRGQEAVELNSGLAALASGDTGQALRSLRQAAATSPDSAEVRNALGMALGRSGDLESAVRELRQAASLQPDRADIQFNLGAALWYSGDRAAAASALAEAIRLDPAYGAAYSLRGVALREAGDLPGAQLMLQRALALNPQLPISYFDLGVLFLRKQDLAHALGQFEAGLNLPAPAGAPPDLDVAISELRTAAANQSSAEAQFTLGRLMGLRGAEPREVVAALESAARIKWDFPEAHNSLGLVYTQTGDDPKAMASFREAIRLRPDYPDAHANLGAILTATDPVGSVKELERAVALQPGLLKAHYNLAIAYGSSPKHGVQAEIAQLRKLLALDANYPRANLSLGKALLRTGAIADAITSLQRAVALDPQSGEAHYQLGLALSRGGLMLEAAESLQKGRALIAASQRDQGVLLDMSEGRAALEKGNLDQAAAKFRHATTERPDYAEAHFQLGLTLARRGEAALAVAEFRKALELDPRHSGAKEEVARRGGDIVPAEDDATQMAELESYVRARRFKEVQPLLEAYVKQRPGSKWGWYALGYSLFAQQKIGESIQALAKCLSLDVTHADAHKVLGRDLMMIGRFDAAQREFELGEKYDPRSAEMPFNLGRLFSIQDQWVPARAAFERALKIDPGYMEALDGLGFALEALGDDEAALNCYRKAARLNEERNGEFAVPYVNLSAYNNRIGNSEAALEFARKAVAVNPKVDRGWFQLARAQERRGELDAAVDSLVRAISINGRVSSYYYVLGTVYRRLGKPQESRDALEMFSKLDRESNELDQKRRDGLRLEEKKNE